MCRELFPHRSGLRAVLVLACLPAAAPVAQAGEAPIVLQGQAAYYGLQVPPEIQALTLQADLGDLQVLNARGDPLPFAWAEPAVELSTAQHQAVPFFRARKPAAAPASAAASAAPVPIEDSWILDTRQAGGVMMQLELKPSAEASGIYRFAIEASTDLQRWSTVQEVAQMVVLQHQGLQLTNTSFQLEGVHAAYLRLRPLAGSAAPPIDAATVTVITTGQQPAATAPLQWSAPIAPTRCTPQACDYALPRHFPVERLEWQLADANTLARVRTLALPLPQAGFSAGPAATAHRHGLRNRLRELRGKPAYSPAAASPPEPEWITLADTMLYWLRLPEGEVRSPASTQAGELFAMLRLLPTGGMAQLGAHPPLLRIGARAPALFFLAREPAPFRLQWGGANPAAALPLATLMPARKAGDALPFNTATASLPPPVAAPQTSVKPPVAAAAPINKPPTAQAKPPPALWLWAVLAAALALMGTMAWSLLKPKPAKTTEP